MVTCVSEGSYNILFVIALAICIVLVLITAYFYDSFKKAERGDYTSDSARNAKNVAMIAMIVVIIFIAILFLLFFGFQTRMVGVTAHVSTNSIKETRPGIGSFTPTGIDGMNNYE